MMPMDNLIDGRAIAEQIHGETAARIAALRQRGLQPGLAFVRVGEDPASQVRRDERADERPTGHRVHHACPSSGDFGRRVAAARRATQPGPKHPRHPDPGAHSRAHQLGGNLFGGPAVQGRGRLSPVERGQTDAGRPHRFSPLHPVGVHELLIRSQLKIQGAEVVVLGRGNIVGKPMAVMLLQKARHASATVTLCHSQTKDIASHCRRADIIIAAIGVPLFVKADMVKPGAAVVDVGVNRIADPSAKSGSRLVGDVDFATVQPIAGKITPNPGGVGPMTIAILMRNTVQAAETAISQ